MRCGVRSGGVAAAVGLVDHHTGRRRQAGYGEIANNHHNNNNVCGFRGGGRGQGVAPTLYATPAHQPLYSSTRQENWSSAVYAIGSCGPRARLPPPPQPLESSAAAAPLEEANPARPSTRLRLRSGAGGAGATNADLEEGMLLRGARPGGGGMRVLEGAGTGTKHTHTHTQGTHTHATTVPQQ